MPIEESATTLNSLVTKAIEQSRPHGLQGNRHVEILSTYPFNTFIQDDDGQMREYSFPCEIIRVKLTPSETRVYRLIKSPSSNSDTGSVLVFDNRGNPDKELTSDFFPKELLVAAYKRLRDGKISGVLTAVREGALGPTPSEIPASSTLQTYTTDRLKYAHPWDLQEEKSVAEAMYLMYSENSTQPLIDYLTQIAEENQPFAHVIAQYVQSELELLFKALPEGILDSENEDKLALSAKDLKFYDDKSSLVEVNLGKGPQQLERIISYPYPTAKGTVFVSLFRLWDAKNERFKVTRLIQTQPNLNDIEGIRFDSNCTDGVHSLDCHCDCCAQLWMSINIGLEEGKNVLVIEEEDHEGKGYGVVHKGATHMIMREYNKGKDKDDRIGNASAAAAYYALHEAAHDMRSYSGSLAIIQALGIKRVRRVLMGNADKVAALQRSGIEYEIIDPMHASNLSDEARRTLNEKARGLVLGRNGHIHYNGEMDNPNLKAGAN